MDKRKDISTTGKKNMRSKVYVISPSLYILMITKTKYHIRYVCLDRFDGDDTYRSPQFSLTRKF